MTKPLNLSASSAAESGAQGGSAIGGTIGAFNYNRKSWADYIPWVVTAGFALVFLWPRRNRK